MGDNHNYVHMRLSIQPNHKTTLFQHVEVSSSRENPIEHLRPRHLKAIESGITSALSNGEFQVCNLGTIECLTIYFLNIILTTSLNHRGGQGELSNNQSCSLVLSSGLFQVLVLFNCCSRL